MRNVARRGTIDACSLGYCYLELDTGRRRAAYGAVLVLL
jgi:hypothetical protein